MFAGESRKTKCPTSLAAIKDHDRWRGAHRTRALDCRSAAGLIQL